LWFEASSAGIQTVVLNQSGIDIAGEFKALQTDPRRRVREIRDGALQWLYDRHLTDIDSGVFADFLDSPNGQFLGSPYSVEELNRAMVWLLDEEYMTGIRTYGSDLIRPMITTKGSKAVERGQSVNSSFDPSGVTNNVSISGSNGVNFAWNSSHVTQSNTMTQEQIDGIERIVGSVRAMLNPMVLGVSEESTTQAQFIANQVEEEIRTQAPDGGKVKALLLKLVELAATGTVQGGIDALNTMMQQGIAGL